MLSIDLTYNWAAFEACYQVTLEPGRYHFAGRQWGR